MQTVTFLVENNFSKKLWLYSICFANLLDFWLNRRQARFSQLLLHFSLLQCVVLVNIYEVKPPLPQICIGKGKGIFNSLFR